MRRILADIIVTMVFLLGFFMVIADRADLIGLPQYAFNMLFFFIGIPGYITLLHIPERLNPRYRNDEMA